MNKLLTSVINIARAHVHELVQNSITLTLRTNLNVHKAKIPVKFKAFLFFLNTHEISVQTK